MVLIKLGAAAAGAVLLTSCSSNGSCDGATVNPAFARSCASAVRYEGHFYVEVSLDQKIPRGEELGDGAYPACNDTGDCRSTNPAAGFLATDVWRLDGVDPDVAVVGLREGSHRYVVFARPDVAPRQLVKQISND